MAKNAITLTAPVKAKAVDNQKDIIAKIRDMHLLVKDDDGNLVGPVTASDAYVWQFYQQIKQANVGMKQDELISETVSQIDASGGSDDNGPTPVNTTDAPKWTTVAADDVNAHKGFTVAAEALVDAKVTVRRGVIPLYNDLVKNGKAVDFLSWAEPGSQIHGDASKTPMCGIGAYYKIGKDGPAIRNETNAAIPMDIFRKSNGTGSSTPFSSYKYLAMQTSYGKAILEELNEYKKGCRGIDLGGPYGKYHDQGMSSLKCQKELELREFRLNELTSKLRTCKEFDMQLRAIEKLGVTNKEGKFTQTMRVEFDTTQTTDKDGNLIYELNEGSMKPIVIVDNITNRECGTMGYSTFLNLDPVKAQAGGGTWGALEKSGKVVKKPTTPEGTQTGGGLKVDQFPIVNVTTEMALQYTRGVLNWFEKDKGTTSRRELAKTNNQDLLQAMYQLQMELTDACRVFAGSIDKIEGHENGTTLQLLDGKKKVA